MSAVADHPERDAPATPAVFGPSSFMSWARSAKKHLAATMVLGIATTAFAVPITGADLDASVPHNGGLASRKDRERRAEVDSPEAPACLSADDDGDAFDPHLSTLATVFNVHTGEAFALSPSEPTFARFSNCLADRVTGARIDLDPRLLDLLRAIAAANPGRRIELVSGFRSPKLNEMLRKKGHRVASHSQHSLGHAVDFRVSGMTPRELREAILDLDWDGGIGQYDGPSDNFVHADVGPKRYWFER